MEYTYAALLLNESNEELNERNLSAVLDAAGCAVTESRTKALVAALEGVDVDDIGPVDLDGFGAGDGDELAAVDDADAQTVAGDSERSDGNDSSPHDDSTLG